MRSFPFHDVSVGSSAKRSLGIETLLLQGKHEYRHLRKLHPYTLDKPDSVNRVQSDLYDQHVRLERSNRVQNILRAFEKSANCKFHFMTDQTCQSLAHYGMIIDNCYSRFLLGRQERLVSQCACMWPCSHINAESLARALMNMESRLEE